MKGKDMGACDAVPSCPGVHQALLNPILVGCAFTCPQVLKGHGHLLPPALEAAASQQRAQDMADVAAAEQQLRQAAAVEAGARVHVATAGAAAAAVGAVKLPELERSRSQQLRQALHSEPRLGKLLAGAAALAQQGRVLAAHSLAVQAAEAAGASLDELASLPADALVSVLPAGSASLDVARLAEEAQFVEQTLKALDDHTGWMVSRDDALKVFYRHQRGTTVHRWVLGIGVRVPFEWALGTRAALAGPGRWVGGWWDWWVGEQ